MTITPDKNYDEIKKLDIDDNSKTENYKKSMDLLNRLDTNVCNYLSKFIILEGYSYDELIMNIERLMKNKFNIDDPKIVFYIRYKIFDLFENNWFSDNEPLIIKPEIKKNK